MRRLKALFIHGLRVAMAFIHADFRNAMNYPVGFIMRQLTVLLPVIIYFFVAKLIEPTSNVGDDYYTFVVIGLIGTQMLDVGIRSFSLQLEQGLERGWFEMILVAPLRWALLPFAMVPWPMIQTFSRALIIVGLATLLGAEFASEGILVALSILLLAVAAGLAFGVLLAGVKVLAKSGDPLLPLYSLGAQIFSGVYFPVESLPEWLRPVSLLFPHTYVIAALRRTVMSGGADLPGLSSRTAIIALVTLTAVLLPLAMYLFRRSMELGRRMGVLAGY